jgi:predicted Rossmann fold flavoprotein
LKSPAKYCKTVSGVRTTAKITVKVGQKPIITEEGEILFTDYGISGIPVLQVSRYVSKALDRGEKVQLIIDFLPEISAKDVTELLRKRTMQNPGKTIEEMMVGLFNHKLSYILLLEAGLDVDQSSRQITKQELFKLVQTIKEFTMPISDTNSFENAQVCAGGVSTKEIDESTMESKLCKNLYLTGELVDVDGTCGGYNLQWAWSSGYVAGTAAGMKDK